MSDGVTLVFFRTEPIPSPQPHPSVIYRVGTLQISIIIITVLVWGALLIEPDQTLFVDTQQVNPMLPDAKMADSRRNPEQREATPHGMPTYQTK